MKTLTDARPKLIAGILFARLAVAVSAIAADLKVPADYPMVQAAVDAASDGDTIHIAPGVYTEQILIISKRLTLIGQPGTILRATTDMSPVPGIPPIIPLMAIRFSDVTVRGCTFEGDRLAGYYVDPDALDLEGLFFGQSSGNVENCAFYGFRESTPGLEGGDGVVVVNFDDQPVNVRVTGCTFADNNTGVYFHGLPTHQTVNVTIENNTFIGPGPLGGKFSCEGIFIREGVGGRIAGNTISDFSYVGTGADFPISFGIVAANEANSPEFGVLQHLEIEGNTLRDNQIHIAVLKANGSIVSNNHFQGTAPDFLPLGLAATGTNVTIANNQFENMPEGIRLFGDDPNWGTLLGIAINAQVTSNRFCGVTSPFTVQPLATATQTGTALDSCSSPPLVIAPAVLISWPGAEAGWTVESATNVVGPWMPSAATPFKQDGRNNIAVPTEGTHRFFRLR